MKKPSSARGKTRTLELEPFGKRKIDVNRFKGDINPAQLEEILISSVRIPHRFIFFPIETLSPARTVAKGRTNLTIIRPTIVQTDATTPHARFDRRESPNRNPAIQMHFEAAPYGFTGPRTYIMVFDIETQGPCSFTVGGSFGLLSNPGTKSLNGSFRVSLVFNNVQPSDQIFGFLDQISGGAWVFFSANVHLPLPVLTPA